MIDKAARMPSSSPDITGFAARIELAHEPVFTLDTLTIKPATREIMRDDRVEVLEPRVMQVLIALLRANGGVVSRDDLMHACWESRIVGEDAVNRVMSRLRRVAEGIGAGCFQIETVIKVGYRLIADPGHASSQTSLTKALGHNPSRRYWLGGALAAFAGVGTGAWFFLASGADRSLPAAVAPLMSQAMIAMRQDTHEGQIQAIGLYQRVVAIMPDYADGWGCLALAYAFSAHFQSREAATVLYERCGNAAKRALAIDSGNAYGIAGDALARPIFGAWGEVDAGLVRALSRHPDNAALLFMRAFVLHHVGRFMEANAILARLARLVEPTPGLYFSRIILLWSANRLEDADRVAAEARSVYPTHFAIWFAQFYLLLYSSRAGEAIVMADDVAHRPTGIPASEIEHVTRVAQAIQSKDPAERATLVATEIDKAHQAAGLAENAMQFVTALGDSNAAYTIANAYFFGRGFEVPEIRFSAEQATYTPANDRQTWFLFAPSLAPIRADPRFPQLMKNLGLESYWRASHVVPDFRRG